MLKLASEDLITRMQDIEREKAQAIADLLAEQARIPEEAAKRLGEIKTELKALGWHPSRPRKAKAEVAQKGK